MVKWSVDEYLELPRNTVRERQLKVQLRDLGNEERETVVWEFIEKSPSLGLALAKSCCSRPNFFLRVLRRGFRDADASYINKWLDCVVPKIGFIKLVLVLYSTLDEDLSIIHRVSYWLPRYLDHSSSKEVDAYKGLMKKARSFKDEN